MFSSKFPKSSTQICTGISLVHFITLIFNIICIRCYYIWEPDSRKMRFFRHVFYSNPTVQPNRTRTLGSNPPALAFRIGGTLNARTREDVIHDQLLPRSPTFLEFLEKLWAVGNSPKRTTRIPGSEKKKPARFWGRWRTWRKNFQR